MTVAPLVRTLPLREGETATSYVSRLAAHHGTVPREFCSDLGLRWPLLCSGRPEQLKRLSRLSGANLQHLTFWSPVKLEVGRYRAGATTSSVGAFRRTSLRVCPICTSEALSVEGPQAVFQLLEWCVTCLHGCETHGVALCALPPAPNSHEAYDVVGQVLRHGGLIRSSADRPESLQPSAFETHVRARLRSGPGDDWLQPLELAHLHRACLTVGLVALGCTTRRLADLDRKAERRACDAGLEVLSGGPSALEALFDRRRHTNSAGRPYFSRDLGQFHDWLRTMKAEPALDGLRDAVREYVFSNYSVKSDQIVLGACPTAVRRITFDEARQRAGLGVSFLKRLLAHLEGLGLLISTRN